MGAPVINPEPQFCDQNGIPYSSGTITTYIAGTSTPKSTWTDPALTALNTNPIVLNSAGRCVMWADGDLRLVLKDAAGNLIWDQPATTIVSAAMEPVVSAPTIADALSVLGVTGLISAEATARSNADSAEQNARIAADNAEATARYNADNDLFAAIQSEQTDRQTGDADLQNQINILSTTSPTGLVTLQKGTSTSDSNAGIAVNFPTPFADRTTTFACDGGAANPDAQYGPLDGHGVPGHITTAAATGSLVKPDPANPGSVIALPNTDFTWYATGH